MHLKIITKGFHHAAYQAHRVEVVVKCIALCVATWKV